VGNQALKIPQNFVEEETIGQWLQSQYTGTKFTDLYCRRPVVRIRSPLLIVCIGQSGTGVKLCAIYKP